MTRMICGVSVRANRVALRMKALKIAERDLDESFVLSPGPGGQNVNKVATCVILHHRASGQIIKCHQHRTQAANRLCAREMLVCRLESLARQEKRKALKTQAAERARRRKRSVRGKEQMLDAKRQNSQKKQLRRPAHADDVS